MAHKKNPSLEEEEPSPESADGSAREKSGESRRSYYYDDATGYEIYEDKDDADPDQQVDGAEDES